MAAATDQFQPGETAVGLIADSHDHIGHLQKATALFRKRGVTKILHAGDYVNPGSISHFEGLHLIGVFGNNDGERLGLHRAFTKVGGELQGEFGTLTLAGANCGIYHGTEPALKQALIASGLYRFLVFGHTHQAEQQWVGNTLVLNPGSAHGFRSRATVMILNPSTSEVELIDLNQD